MPENQLTSGWRNGAVIRCNLMAHGIHGEDGESLFFSPLPLDPFLPCSSVHSVSSVCHHIRLFFLSISSSVIGTHSPALPSVQSSMMASGAFVSVETESVGRAVSVRDSLAVAGVGGAMRSASSSVQPTRLADTKKAASHAQLCLASRLMRARGEIREPLLPPPYFVSIIYHVIKVVHHDF